MQLDFISDLHSESWLKHLQIPVAEWVKRLLPNSPSSILCIAGDLGHRNKLIVDVLTEFRRYYKHVVLVLGNHDFFINHPDNRDLTYLSSKHRTEELRDLISWIDKVHLLEGNVVDIEGLRIGGTASWYDFRFGLDHFDLTLQEMYWKWVNWIDAIYIKGLFDDPLEFFMEEYEKLEKIINQCHVLLTHVNPDFNNILARYRVPESGFFTFQADKLFQKAGKQLKVWAFGHIHHRYDDLHEGTGIRMINASLGYPGEGAGRRIVTVNI